MNAVVFLAPAPRPQPSTAHATRGRWIPASCCVWPCSLDEIFKSHHSLCARLERMPVSTWNMEVWTEVMTSDLVWVTSKVLKIEGVHGAHGLGKLKHLCHELLPLGGVRANVVTPRSLGAGCSHACVKQSTSGFLFRTRLCVKNADTAIARADAIAPESRPRPRCASARNRIVCHGFRPPTCAPSPGRESRLRGSVPRYSSLFL